MLMGSTVLLAGAVKGRMMTLAFYMCFFTQ